MYYNFSNFRKFSRKNKSRSKMKVLKSGFFIYFSKKTFRATFSLKIKKR